MVQTPVRAIALEAFLQLPETKPASEYIDGEITQKLMHRGEHSTLQLDLASAINSTIKPQKIARAYTELRCTFGERSLVPDISVFLWSRIPRQKDGSVANVFSIAPDWIIEILSPGQSQTKVTKNIFHCLKHGTQMGWLSDPKERAVLVYSQEKQIDLYEAPKEVLAVPGLAKNFKLTVGELFGWLLE
jgi:Uma2 family endonuclease